MAQPPLPDTFGNYAIRGIVEVMPAEAVAWWPVTGGWKVLGALLALLLAWRAYRGYQRWRRNRYRRQALAHLSSLGELPAGERLPRLAALLKTTALAVYPRDEVAPLSGKAWLRWLEASTRTPVFSDSSGRLLCGAQYRADVPLEMGALEQLNREIAAWIRHHEAPSA